MISDDPDLIPRDALRGVTVGISVSNSSDLARLGLDPRHAELAVGEIARAILLAGGIIAYGGRLRPSGFTQQLMNEVQRFGSARHSLTLYLALPEHQTMDRAELDHVDRQLGTWGNLQALDAQGEPTEWRILSASQESFPDDERAAAYSALRRQMADNTDARILVGGQLRGFKGSLPGVVEESILAIQRDQPLYLAGGFGGAAAAVAHHLDPESFAWLPPGLPEGESDEVVRAALDRVQAVAAEREWTLSSDGLTPERRGMLNASHRPGEIASLCVVGLAARFAGRHEERG